MSEKEIWYKLYRATSDKTYVDDVLKNGFKENAFFAKDLQDAIVHGRYVFEVVFTDEYFKKNCPDFWSNPFIFMLICREPIPSSRILSVLEIDKKITNNNTELYSKYMANYTDYRANTIQGGNPTAADFARKYP